MSFVLRNIRRFTASHWRTFCFTLCVGSIIGLVVWILVPGSSGAVIFGLYSIPSNSFVPVPHEPGLLYYAKFYDPIWIAIAGSIGSGIAAFADYEVLERTFRHPRVQGIRNTPTYKWAVRWIMARPFVTIVLFAATPLPVYVVRVLAPASGYSVWRYTLAMMLGRFPRFYVLAWVGFLFQIPTWVLITMFAILIASLVYTAMSGSGAEDEVPETGDAAADPLAELAADIAAPVSALADSQVAAAGSSSPGLPVVD